LTTDRGERSGTLRTDVVARRSGAAMGAIGALLLAACAGAPSALAPGSDAAYTDGPFTAAGRLSARHGSEAIAVHFRWDHRPPRDELAVTSPLGQTVAELSGDAAASRVEVRTADGRRAEAADWMALTEQTLGFPLPVSGLAAWIRGSPHAGAAYTREPDREGRIAVLRQDGWEIVYDYPDSAARAPLRLRITYPEFEIRVVVDEWR
jgi:outer membrane lipoprotein LolB